MIKPILLVPDRHWDTFARRAMLMALPMLRRYGYDTYCHEMRSDYSTEQQLEIMDHTITTIEAIQASARPYLQSRGIDVEKLCDMPFEKLSDLLRNYVTSKKYTEYAVSLKELPAHRLTREIFNKIIHLHGSYQGVDIIDAEGILEFSSLDDYGIVEKNRMVKLKEKERIHSFVSNALKLQNQGKGVILVIGKVHYENLLTEFHNQSCLGELVVVYPHSERTFANAVDDRKLNLSNQKLRNKFPCITRRLYNEKQLPEFVDDLECFLKPILKSFYHDIPEHPITEKITSNLGVKFFARQRPSMYIDSFHPIANDENEAEVTKKLADLGIFSTVAVVDEKKQMMIPCVNSTGVCRKL